MSARAPLHESIRAARDDFRTAIAGVALSEDEQSIATWAERAWDQSTLHTMASIIRKARSAGSAPESSKCAAITYPGETFEHWCELDAEHTGDHRCGDCGDVWNAGPWDDEIEPHWEYSGTCTLCTAEAGE